MKPVIYIRLPEVPRAFICDYGCCFAVNLECCDLPLAQYAEESNKLPQSAQSKYDLREKLKVLNHL